MRNGCYTNVVFGALSPQTLAIDGHYCGLTIHAQADDDGDDVVDDGG